MRLSFCLLFIYCFFEVYGFLVGIVADHVGEKERVAERLEQQAVENPADGP